VVVDTSALIAILLGEPERDRFIHLLADADDPVISAATLVEASIVMLAKTGPDGVHDLDDLLTTAAPPPRRGRRFPGTHRPRGLSALRQGPGTRRPQLRRLLPLRARKHHEPTAPVQRR